MGVQPITPDEVATSTASFPDFVLEAFNELLQRKARNGRANITQDEAVALIIAKAPHAIHRQTVFDNNWLDVENVYRAAGWNVTFDKPGFNESYGAFFVFERT